VFGAGIVSYLWLIAAAGRLELHKLDRRRALAYSAALAAAVVLVPLAASRGGAAAWWVLVAAATAGLALLAALALLNLWPLARGLAR